MTRDTVLAPPPPLEWKPGLVGEFPGQRSRITLRGRDGADTGVEMVFCWCPPGQAVRQAEGVTSTTRGGFWIGQHLVNQRQWQAVTGKNPSRRGKGETHPVDTVSWDDAKEFCRVTGLRLPTEAEWEYACRAGTGTEFAVGGGEAINSQRANFNGNYPDGEGRDGFKWLYRERTLAGGSFPPNAWGLHDMHGQLWEWCEDEIAGGRRVLRGGCWIDFGVRARSSSRSGYAPGNPIAYLGFRSCPSSISPSREAGGRKGSAERGKE